MGLGTRASEVTESLETVEEIMAADELQPFMINDSKETKERCGIPTLRSLIVKTDSAAHMNIV